jgi:hypothetical protein
MATGVWETWDMKKPHLMISKGEFGFGLRGRCSSCAESAFEIVAIAKEQSEDVLRAAFDVHFKSVHMRGDASPTAAGIVRDATNE